MYKKINILFLLAIIIIPLSSSAFAHTSHVIGDYKIKVGWDDEDATVGMKNIIVLQVFHATDFDKQSVAKMDPMNNEAPADDTANDGEGIDNLSKDLNVDVTVGEKTIPLNLEETKFAGVYFAKFMPSMAGSPEVHVTGNVLQTPVDITFHPEEIAELSTLSPLKQMENGINPSDVQCKSNLELFMRIQTESAICTSPENGQKLLELGVVDYF